MGIRIIEVLLCVYIYIYIYIYIYQLRALIPGYNILIYLLNFQVYPHLLLWHSQYAVQELQHVVYPLRYKIFIFMLCHTESQNNGISNFRL